MVKIKNAVFIGWLFIAAGLNAQTLKIDDCYRLAKENFPLVKQYELLEKTKEFSIENAQKAYLPQFGIYGQATYQSDVTKLPFDFSNVPVPGLSDITIPTLSKDQYRLYGEVSYSLTDLATTKNQSDLVKANTEVEKQKLEVELYKLRERINSLFFGVLLIDAQIAQAELVKNDNQNGINRAEVAIANGVALRSAADNLKAEWLKTKQRTTGLRATRKGYCDMLSLFIGQKIDESTVFDTPQLLKSPLGDLGVIDRPEMQLFHLQNRAFDLQNRLITNKNLPRLSLFLQGGFGKPALNMFSNNFDPYYITGVRLSWNLTGYWTFKNEREQILINQTGTQIQQETFLFNTNLTLSQQNAEIAQMQELIADDSEIILLREKVKNAAQTQLENGTATTNDYLIAVNAEDQARQNRILHEIQLLLAQYNANTTAGN
ncbi:MAG: TolC family protein [Prevotellaceae bacterium]|jgi:outer membrane protein TolC|nr:TolC family protein [Prevotellaceae bacterium]